MFYYNHKKSFFIALVALLVAAVGVVIGLAAYFKHRDSYLYDDDDDFVFDDLEYYDGQTDAQPAPEGEESF